eukprot:359993-Chlamydomonas_euryale.AAC.8
MPQLCPSCVLARLRHILLYINTHNDDIQLCLVVLTSARISVAWLRSVDVRASPEHIPFEIRLAP